MASRTSTQRNGPISVRWASPKTKTRCRGFLFLSVSVLAASMGVSFGAAADPGSSDKEAAHKLMAEGRANRDKGDLNGALAAFSAADALMHVTTTGLEVARTQLALGLLVEAHETAARVAHIPEKPDDPQPIKLAREAANKLADDVQARLPSLSVIVKNVPDGASAVVTIDDAPLPSDSIGKARNINPGHHVVEAKAGSSQGKEEIDLPEKDQKEITIDLHGVVTTAVVGPPPREPAPANDDVPVVTETSSTSKVLTFGGFGLAGVAGVVGTITGVLSLSKTNSIKNSNGCANKVCGPTEYGDINSARSMATVSTVSFIVAGTGAVLGIVGLVTGHGTSASTSGPEKPPADESASRIEPWLGPGSAGLRGSF